jgi:predicted lipoprotein with Yx(FWY)xxD motif
MGAVRAGPLIGISRPLATGRPAALVGHGDVARTGLGNVLVDSKGRTIYLFKKDSGTKSVCRGECAIEWPPVRANGEATVGDGANASMVATTKRSDGKPQVTYNGHPLYLYEGDQNPATQMAKAWRRSAHAGMRSLQPEIRCPA